MVTGPAAVERLVGVSLNAAIDKVAAVDRLEPGRIHRPELLAAVPGGKALNAVRVARTLGAAADIVAVVAGHAGTWVQEQLAARGIPGWFVRVEGETRTCLSVLDRESGRLTEFYERGLDLPDTEWDAVAGALQDALVDRPGATVVLLAGSLPPGAPVDAYRRLAAQASAAGARVVVDVGGPPRAAALAARPGRVKSNAAEAAATTGLPTTDRGEVATAARRLIRDGAERALVTMGVEGAVLVTDAGAWNVGRAPEVWRINHGSRDA